MDLNQQFRTFLESDSTFEYIVLAALAVALSFLVHYIIFKILKLIDRKSDAELWDAILSKGFQSTRYFLVVIFLFITKSVFVNDQGETEGLIQQILSISLIATFAWLLVSTVNVIRASLLSRYDVGEENNLRARKVHTQFKLLGNILKFVIVIIAIGLALMTFESIRKFGVSLLASAGIAGIILGFAAQRLIATVLAGLQLAISQPIRLDDVVIVEGEWGKVEEMTLTFVVIAIWDKRRLVVPSTYFIEKPFQNWTRVSSDLLGTVFIHTDYRFPVDALREELKRVVEQSKLWDQKVAIVQVTEANQKTMEMRVLVSSKDAPTGWDLRVEVREKLIAFIQREYPEMLPVSRVSFDEKELKK
ncbi:MAG: mechanosensitive ion channel domain-containing protein [Cryomorphaceae bacterium]